MSLLGNLTTDSDIKTEEDRVGGIRLFDSGVYDGKISMAYVTESKGGAMCLNVNFDIDGRELRQRFWMTSGKAKGQRNYYETKDGAKAYLPGFNMANSLCLLTVGKEINAMDTDSKMLKLWSPEAKAEVPTEVPVVTGLLGQEITLGVVKQTVDKMAKGDSGAYEPTGETREENEVDKFFRTKDKLTTAEIRAQVTEPGFFDTWKSKFTNTVRDKTRKRSTNSTAKTSSALGGSAGSAGKPTESLFS